jgi:hypothetical protein
MITDYTTLIRQARVKVSSPEAVAAYLSQRSHDEIAEDIADLEPYLYSLKIPIIDISLARYCGSQEVLRNVYLDKNQDEALQLACFANQNVRLDISGMISSEFPYSIFKNSLESIVEFLKNSSSYQIQAIFKNSGISTRFLREILESDGAWSILDEARQILIVSSLSQNEIFQKKFSHIDELQEWYEHRKIIEASLRLADIVPVNEKWAAALAELYEGILNCDLSPFSADHISERWQVPSHNGFKESDRLSNRFYCLSPRQIIRKKLAIFSNDKNNLTKFKFLNSRDISLRCASYEFGNVSFYDIICGLSRDKFIALSHFLRNDHCWTNRFKIKILKAYYFYDTIVPCVDDDFFVQLSQRANSKDYQYSWLNEMYFNISSSSGDQIIYNKIKSVNSRIIGVGLIIIFALIIF